MLLSEEPDAMDVLLHIPHVLWVYGQGIISLKHTQYTCGSHSSKSHGTQAGGPDLVRTTKQQRPSSGCCMLLYGEQQQGMDVLTYIPHVFACVWERSDLRDQI